MDFCSLLRLLNLPDFTPESYMSLIGLGLGKTVLRYADFSRSARQLLIRLNLGKVSLFLCVPVLGSLWVALLTWS